MDLVDLNYMIKHLFRSFFFEKKERTVGATWYYFLHIPKTAGTSFRYALYDHFPPESIYPNSVDYYLKNKGRYLEWPEFVNEKRHLFPEKRSILMGHYGVAPWTAFTDHPPVTIAFFREPVDRILSSIAYHRKKGRRYSGLSLEEIIEKYQYVEGQMQARAMGFHRKKDNFPEAMQNLEKLDGIGLTGDYERSLKLFNNTFDWNLQPAVSRNIKRKKDRLPESLRAKIQSICTLDYQIFQKASQLYQNMCAQQGL